MTIPDAARWAQIKALFEATADAPAAERDALMAAAGLDAAARAELLSLLAHHDQAAQGSEFMAEGAMQAIGSGIDEPPAVAAQPGQRLGAWEIVRPIGAGGMGEVFEARRADGQYDGRAAVKLLKRGMDSAAVLQRFALERQALARLSHPHIARLLDAGASADGLPYFVLEYVDGQPIDVAVLGQTLEQRLHLFLQLADAVAHAHRNLLVHRDLKPGNVLVDSEGRVKLLDFGIAKALDPLEHADGNATLGGVRPYTANYASPEQVRGEPVSTATDIYSLGVLLYQMLTGTRPTGRNARTPAEAARSVLEDAPTRPSRLPASDAVDAEWLRTRKKLEGDLDNILLRALEKAPEQRYASVDALRADVQAYLRGYPVQARAASRGYLWRKFVARHRAAVAAGALAAVAVVAGGGAALWQAQRADAQRDEAQAQRQVAEAQRQAADARFLQVRRMANDLVFKYHDQIERLPGATEVRMALLTDAARYLDGLRSSAAGDPLLARDLASAYYRISYSQGISQSSNSGEYLQAAAMLKQALDLTPLYVDQPDLELPALTEVADMWVSQAELLQRQGRLAEAVKSMDRGNALLGRALARDPKHQAALTTATASHGALARMLGSSIAHANLGRVAQAGQHLEQARAYAEQLLAVAPGLESENVRTFVLGEQVNWVLLNGRFTEALPLARELAARRQAASAGKPQDMEARYQHAGATSNLASALGFAGQHDESLVTMAQARALLAAAARSDSGNPAAQRNQVIFDMLTGRLHVLAGRFDEARGWLGRALAAMPPAASGDFVTDRWRADALLWLARACQPAQPACALAAADESLQMMQATGAAAAAAPAVASASAPASATASPPGISPAPALDENRARRWMLALAQGERALALQALGSQDAPATAAAAAAAREAETLWAGATPDGAVPASFLRFVQPVRALLAGVLPAKDIKPR